MNLSIYNLKLTFVTTLMVISFGANSLTAQLNDQVSSILNSFAKDYEKDVMLKEDVTFGIKVDDVFWHVIAKAKTDDADAKVSLVAGEPEEPTFYFYTDFETLQKVNNGEMNALTGAAKAFSSDFAPFDADIMEGFVPDETFVASLLSVMFHFWTKGNPEIIPYGIDYTRFTHGAQASIFYYQPGFRSGYVAIKKGQHANEDKNSQSNPFPTLLIAIKGEGIMVIDGKEHVFREGHAVLIPAGVRHEFLNPDNDEPLECILLMFGDGA